MLKEILTLVSFFLLHIENARLLWHNVRVSEGSYEGMEYYMKKTEVECCDTVFVHDEIICEVKQQMPEETTLKDLADFYKVFGDPTRIRILWVLLQKEVCVCDLAEILEMSQSAISHQLRVLKQMKLVKNRRDGKTVFYSLADNHIQTIINQGMEHIAE